MTLTPRGRRVRDYGIVVLSGAILVVPFAMWLYGVHV